MDKSIVDGDRELAVVDEKHLPIFRDIAAQVSRDVSVMETENMIESRPAPLTREEVDLRKELMELQHAHKIAELRFENEIKESDHKRKLELCNSNAKSKKVKVDKVF